MSSFLDDVIGTPRRRPKSHGRSPLSSPPLQQQRAPSPDVFHSALAVPTRASLSSAGASSVGGTEVRGSAGGGDIGAEAPASAGGGEEVRGKDGAEREEQPVEGSTKGDEPVAAEVESAETEVVEKEGSTPAQHEGGGPEPESEPATLLHVIHEPILIVNSSPAILMGIAGCVSSGKTTLSHLLSGILPPSTPRFIIHQNDFFVPKSLLVPSSSGELDADCREAVDFASLVRVVKYAKREGRLPPGFRNRQDESYALEQVSSMVNDATMGELKILLADSAVLEEGQPVGIVDGFLLYSEPEIRDLLDVKLFLRTTKEKAVTRRFEKLEDVGDGTEEDFWKTREYFDKTVWPNYVREHAPLFKDNHVEGEPLPDLCEGLAISMQPELEMSVEETARWAANSIVERVRALSIGQSRSLDPEEVLPGMYEMCDCGEGWLGQVRRFLCEHV